MIMSEESCNILVNKYLGGFSGYLGVFWGVWVVVSGCCVPRQPSPPRRGGVARSADGVYFGEIFSEEQGMRSEGVGCRTISENIIIVIP